VYNGTAEYRSKVQALIESHSNCITRTSEAVYDTMVKVAVIQQGSAQVITRQLQEPTPEQVQLQVLATAIHHLVRARALGKHYSSSSTTNSVEYRNIGVDGVGSTKDGTLYYFTDFESDGSGSFAEYVNVNKEDAYPLPASVSLNDTATINKVAVLANSVMASYLALGAKGIVLPESATVLINGVTGSGGTASIDVFRGAFGGDKVIGVARSEASLKPALKQKLTDFIALESPLTDDAEVISLLQKYDIDVVLDYVWGNQALRLLKLLIQSRRDSSSRPVHWVQIGQIGGAELALPAGLLRSHNLNILGSGLGSFSKDKGREVFQSLVNDIVTGTVGNDAYDKIETADINDIATEWDQWRPDLRKAFAFR
jgi:NADPH:quinone reductase-like Zn-dependent oxidoreductase